MLDIENLNNVEVFLIVFLLNWNSFFFLYKIYLYTELNILTFLIVKVWMYLGNKNSVTNFSDKIRVYIIFLINKV